MARDTFRVQTRTDMLETRVWFNDVEITAALTGFTLHYEANKPEPTITLEGPALVVEEP